MDQVETSDTATYALTEIWKIVLASNSWGMWRHCGRWRQGSGV